MNEDQFKGRITEVKGAVREAAGKMFGRAVLEQEGKLQRVTGKAQAAYGDIKNQFPKTS